MLVMPADQGKRAVCLQGWRRDRQFSACSAGHRLLLIRLTGQVGSLNTDRQGFHVRRRFHTQFRCQLLPVYLIS